MPDSDSIHLIYAINDAFKNRARPKIFTVSKQLSSYDIQEVEAITSHCWQDLTVSHWEENFDAISLMSPEAYCYYLPGVMKVSIEAGVNLIVVSTVLSCLDRSANKDWWDDLFACRWTLFTVTELKVVQAWIFWIASLDDSPYSDDSLERALITIDLLIESAPDQTGEIQIGSGPVQ